MVRAHSIKLRDAAIATGAILAAGFAALEYDLGSSLATDKRIQLEEAMALAILVIGGFLCFAWRRASEQEQEIIRRIAAEQRAHELAHTDLLTGLANRRAFERVLAEVVASPPSADCVHAVLALDLNGFKAVNDVYGHAAGDEVLAIVAQRFKGAVRNIDLLARLGGDEFAVIAKQLAGTEGAASLAARLLRSVENPIAAGNNQHRIGSGIGVALIPSDGSTVEDVMRKADIALYEAKNEDRSAVRFFAPEMDRRSREEDTFAYELTAAIEADELVPWFQPIVDLQTRTIVAFEALARWTHPVMGSIPPERFISVAEEWELMHELSDRLLHHACRRAMDWPEDITLCFNISPSQLTERTLGLHILGVLSKVGLPPHRLEIEITESTILRDVDVAREVLEALRDAGVRIALDDFGSGYSSFHHLRNFKFDTIKIDRSFVQAMVSESESAAIVHALTGLGRELDLTVTAEGIELPEQLIALLKQGCQQGQGFLFSRPVRGEATAALLAGPAAGQRPVAVAS
jgi:diguanylate cyclase (GGDEF)-like protein